MNVFRDPSKNQKIKFEQEADKGGGGDHSVHRIGILRQHSRFAPNIIEILDMVEGVKK